MDWARKKASFRRRAKEALRSVEMGGRKAERPALAVTELPAFQGARTVLAFVSLGDEPPTRPLLEAVLASGKRLCLPRIVSGQSRFEAAAVGSLDELRPGVYGISEPPPSAAAVDPSELDLVIVPALAFDVSGNRLGRGGGYYDRFLAALPPHAVTVGLTFEAALWPRVPVEAHDVPVQWIVTESRTMRAQEGGARR